MYQIVVADQFRRRYEKLPAAIQKKILKQEKLLSENPFQPSLHTEKLQPKNKEYWSVRVDKRYRILFRFLSGTEIVLITVGTHDWLYSLV